MANKIPGGWFLCITRLIVMVSMTIASISCTDDIRETSQNRFMGMVKDREVYWIAIINNKWVEVHLTPNALASDKYQTYFSDKMQYKRPQFKFRITSQQVLRDDLLKLNPTLPITSEKRSFLESNS